jgi:hypothetical protein
VPRLACAGLNTPQDADFSDEFCRFLQTCVTSVDAAEQLLRLKREAPQELALDADGLRHLATLEKVYLERPVTLFRVIYGLRDAKIRSFAEAFKLARK